MLRLGVGVFVCLTFVVQQNYKCAIHIQKKRTQIKTNIKQPYQTSMSENMQLVDATW